MKLGNNKGSRPPEMSMQVPHDWDDLAVGITKCFVQAIWVALHQTAFIAMSWCIPKHYVPCNFHFTWNAGTDELLYNIHNYYLWSSHDECTILYLRYCKESEALFLILVQKWKLRFWRGIKKCLFYYSWIIMNKNSIVPALNTSVLHFFFSQTSPHIHLPEPTQTWQLDYPKRSAIYFLNCSICTVRVVHWQMFDTSWW